MAESQEKPVWQRLPNETPKAYEAFVLYRDMGPGRTAIGVARHLGKSGNLIHRWSTLYRWPERARAWDDMEATAARDAAVNALTRGTTVRVETEFKERDEWISGKKERARKLTQRGDYLLSLPPREEYRETEKGPLIIKAANTSDYWTGMRMVALGDRFMQEALAESLAAASFAPAPDGPLPELTEARSEEVHKLNAFADSLIVLVSRGNTEAGNLLLRVMERKSRLLGLDAPPAAPIPGGTERPAPTIVEVRLSDARGESGSVIGGDEL